MTTAGRSCSAGLASEPWESHRRFPQRFLAGPGPTRFGYAASKPPRREREFLLGDFAGDEDRCRGLLGPRAVVFVEDALLHPLACLAVQGMRDVLELAVL